MILKVIEWTYYVCCMVCMVCVGEWTFRWTVKDKKRFIMAGVIYVIGYVFLQLQGDSLIPFCMLFYIGEIVAWVLISRGRFGERLIKIVAIFFGVGVVEAGVRFFMEILLRDKMPKEMISLVAILLSIGSLAIITRQKWYQKLIEYMRVLKKRVVMLILLIIVGGLVIVGYGNMVQDIVKYNELVWLYQGVLVIELFLVVGIIVILVVESKQKIYYWEQNTMKEEILYIQREYYKTIYEKDREMRSFRHDLANQLGMLQLLLRKGDLEEAKAQLECIGNKYTEASFHKVYVGDEILDAVLSMMKQEAKKKHMCLEVFGRIESEKQYNVYELCTIFSNAIRNSIEACEKIGSRGPICVNILEEKKALLCTVENPAIEEMYLQIKQGTTSKEDRDNHGFGVENIRRAVKQLSGELEYYYKDGKITLEIQI